jgi:hypothetical protein
VHFQPARGGEYSGGADIAAVTSSVESGTAVVRALRTPRYVAAILVIASRRHDTELGQRGECRWRALAGRRLKADVVEGRPPKTMDVTADDGSTCRYGLAEWLRPAGRGVQPRIPGLATDSARPPRRVALGLLGVLAGPLEALDELGGEVASSSCAVVSRSARKTVASPSAVSATTMTFGIDPAPLLS